MMAQVGVAGIPNEVRMRSLQYRGRHLPGWDVGRGRVPVQVITGGKLHGIGMGDTTTSPAVTPAPAAADSFTGGLMLWTSPTVAIQLLAPAVTGFTSHPMTSVGLLVPPLLLLAAVMSAVGGSGRRR